MRFTLLFGLGLVLAPPAAAEVPQLDPLTDTAWLVVSVGFTGLTEAIIRTGEIRPQEPGDSRRLLGLDRQVAERDDNRELPAFVSDLGAATAGVYVIADSVMTGMGTGWRAGVTDFVLYLESAATNWSLANIAKLAVRRPRPRAYLDAGEGRLDDDTDSALSFYSGHTAVTSGLSATAAYLAFVRHPDGNHGWYTLLAGAALTTLVAAQRVESRAHFPTDVIAGALVGIPVGLYVPHVHCPGRQGFGVRLSGFTAEESSGLTLSGWF
jgi:hypothetical protein